MKRQLPWILPLLLLIVGFLGMLGLRALRAEPQSNAPTRIVPTVEVETVHRGQQRYVITTQGTVTPRTTSRLVAEVAGRVLRVAANFEAGGFFEQGDTLVWLDDRDAWANLANAEAERSAAQLRLELAEEESRVAAEEWKSLNSEAPSALVLRQPQLEEARAQLRATSARLAKAQRDLRRTRLTAPYQGRIGSKLADVGDYLGPAAPAAVLYAVDFAEVRLPIPDRELAYLNLSLGRPTTTSSGAKPEVRLSAEFAQSRHEWIGTIERSEGEIDPATRMVNLVARVDDPYGIEHGAQTPLAAGMFVDAAILGRQVEACSIPNAALYQDSRVLVVDADLRIEIREVEVLRRGVEHALIGEGLEDGERICTSPLATVVDGMQVRPATAMGESR